MHGHFSNNYSNITRYSKGLKQFVAFGLLIITLSSPL